jgi:hypothetical protein
MDKKVILSLCRFVTPKLYKKEPSAISWGRFQPKLLLHARPSAQRSMAPTGRKSKFAPKAVEGFLLGYDSNTRAYRVFNKSTGLVEVSCDIVFDETNGSQVEQVDLDELDDEEAPCIALRNMSIGDVCPKESERAHSSTRSTILLHASISTNSR